MLIFNNIFQHLFARFHLKYHKNKRVYQKTIFLIHTLQYNYLFLLSGYFKNTIHPTHPLHSLSHL